MEGEAAAAVLQVLVQNLIDASKKEISLFRGLNKDAEKLTTTLLTIQAFLNDAEMRTVPNHEEAVRSWLLELEDAAFDADNVLDELNYHRISKEIKKAIEPSKGKKVLSCFSFCTRVSRRRKMVVKIKKISENLGSINKKATELGLVEKLANVPTVSDVGGSETDSYTLIEDGAISSTKKRKEINNTTADARTLLVVHARLRYEKEKRQINKLGFVLYFLIMKIRYNPPIYTKYLGLIRPTIRERINKKTRKERPK